MTEDVGYRYRMDDVTAAIAVAQLERLEEKRRHRIRVATVYRQRLLGLPECELVSLPPQTEPTWYIFPILVPPAERDQLRRWLAEHRIDTSVHYPPLNEQPVFSGVGDKTPRAAAAARRLLSLPLHEEVGEGDAHRVCDRVCAYVAPQAEGRERARA